jgi:hypothetical protein
MASTSEVGHAKNLANLQKLIDLASQLGPSYNPTNTKITLASLNTLLTNCTTDYNNWVTKYAFWKTTTNSREMAFKPIGQLCTQILDNVSALNVTNTVDDISAVVHKIHGYTKKIDVPDPTPGDGGTGTGGSTSGTSGGNSTEKQSGGNSIPVIPIISISTSQKSYEDQLKVANCIIIKS